MLFLAIVCLCLSILAMVCFFGYLIKTFVFTKNTMKKGISIMLLFSGVLMVSTACLRGAILFYEAYLNQGCQWEWLVSEITEMILNTFRIFSMDSDYKGLVADLRALGNSNIIEFFVFYASMICIVAPVTGGAILFEVLANIFPKVRLFAERCKFWKTRYYFSELNETSIALAKNIGEVDKRKAVLIFTDAYVDKKDEKRSELLLEARSIGGICIEDDITHVKKGRRGKKSFLLMDEDEMSNLRTLADLAQESNYKYLNNSKIFFVTNSDAYIEIERSIYEKIKKNEEQTGEKAPVFVPIQSTRNLISNLLVDVPLFEPLIDKEDKSSLTVTILGTGSIGTEMFLTTYWIGQILNCKLNINIVSNETEEHFWNRIDYINPEIKCTTRHDDEILRVSKDEKSEPYCSVNYIYCDSQSTEFMNCLSAASESNILNTDYYFVSLGTDAINISVANKIKKATGAYHLELENRYYEKKAEISEPYLKTVIAFVVYDPTTAEILNSNRKFSSYARAGKDEADIYMRAVGSLNEVYSVENVFLMKHKEEIEKIHHRYIEKQDSEFRDENENRVKNGYEFWSSFTRGSHRKYKMFSMGICYPSVFVSDEEEYPKGVTKALTEFKEIATGKKPIENCADSDELVHKLAWLEHRRWNAFMRVKGFRNTNDFGEYLKEKKTHKNMDLCLHPCLVECNKKGIDIKVTENGKIINKDEFDIAIKENAIIEGEGLDLLEQRGIKIDKNTEKEKKTGNLRFKQFDYLIYEYDEE